MSEFEKAEEQAIDEALKRQAEPMHPESKPEFGVPFGHPELVIRDPVELGWDRVPKLLGQMAIAPAVRHINRIWHSQQWLA